jgi:hypothetical protein
MSGQSLINKLRFAKWIKKIILETTQPMIGIDYSVKTIWNTTAKL